MSTAVLIEDKKKNEIFLNEVKRFTAPRWFLPRALGATPYIITLAANGTSGPIPIEFDEANGHSEIFGLVSQSTGDYLIEIEDKGRNHRWQNRPVHNTTITGNAQRPYILPLSYFLNVSVGTRQLTVTFTDISGAPNDIRFAMQGRVFMYRQATRFWPPFWLGLRAARTTTSTLSRSTLTSALQ